MWRKPTLQDAAATLSQAELNAFRTSPDYATASDPVVDLLNRTAQFVRGFCRKNRQLTMCPTPYTLPESLISPAMDYLAYDVLKRLPTQMKDSREKARDQAIELFKSVANCEFTPENWEQGETDESSDSASGRAMPNFGEARHKFLNGQL